MLLAKRLRVPHCQTTLSQSRESYSLVNRKTISWLIKIMFHPGNMLAIRNQESSLTTRLTSRALLLLRSSLRTHIWILRQSLVTRPTPSLVCLARKLALHRKDLIRRTEIKGAHATIAPQLFVKVQAIRNRLRRLRVTSLRVRFKHSMSHLQNLF